VATLAQEGLDHIFRSLSNRDVVVRYGAERDQTPDLRSTHACELSAECSRYGVQTQRYATSVHGGIEVVRLRVQQRLIRVLTGDKAIEDRPRDVL
jgi:hypothetical protein